MAREAGVKLLALTHVSTRYFGHQVVEEATQLFPATVVPRDFDVVTIPFPERGEPELVRSGARTRRAPPALRARRLPRKKWGSGTGGYTPAASPLTRSSEAEKERDDDARPGRRHGEASPRR